MSDKSYRKAAWPIMIGVAVFVLLLIIGALLGIWWLNVSRVGDIAPQLRDRGRLAVVGEQIVSGLSAEGTETVQATTLPQLPKVLSQDDERALRDVLAKHEINGLLVGPFEPLEDPDDSALAARFKAFDAMDLFEAEVISKRAAFYLPYDPLALDPAIGDALALLARKILANEPAPRYESFPEPLRAPREVEIMVMLRDEAAPRLWRSARGGTVAKALITAAVVARQRWREREEAMGGALSDLLAGLTVEVWLLRRDGTLADRDPEFIEQVFKPEHGVAYERKGEWRYMLPEMTRAVGEGSAVRAYQELFESNGQSKDSLQHSDLALYRLRAELLGESPPLTPSQ